MGAPSGPETAVSGRIAAPSQQEIQKNGAVEESRRIVGRLLLFLLRHIIAPFCLVFTSIFLSLVSRFNVRCNILFYSLSNNLMTFRKEKECKWRCVFEVGDKVKLFRITHFLLSEPCWVRGRCHFKAIFTSLVIFESEEQMFPKILSSWCRTPAAPVSDINGQHETCLINRIHLWEVLIWHHKYHIKPYSSNVFI